jgi:hypothetical protein
MGRPDIILTRLDCLLPALMSRQDIGFDRITFVCETDIGRRRGPARSLKFLAP